jgi:hypothetical protein
MLLPRRFFQSLGKEIHGLPAAMGSEAAVLKNSAYTAPGHQCAKGLGVLLRDATDFIDLTFQTHRRHTPKAPNSGLDSSSTEASPPGLLPEDVGLRTIEMQGKRLEAWRKNDQALL